MGRYVFLGALCLVVRGRHIGGVISWGRLDRKSIQGQRLKFSVESFC